MRKPTPQQEQALATLAILHKAGFQNVTPKRLAKRMGCGSAGSAGIMLRGLEALGFAERRQQGRLVFAQITQKGVDHLRERAEALPD